MRSASDTFLPPTAEAVERAIEGVHLDGASIELDPTPQAKDAAVALARLVARRGTVPATTDIRFGLDPFGAQALTGRAPLPWRELAPIFGHLVSDLAGEGFRGPFAVADGQGRNKLYEVVIKYI